MEKHLLAYYIGIFIVFFTHIAKILTEKFSLSSMATQHNLINIVGSVLIAYYFTHKEKFIKF